jgi:hypothetical protein
MVNPLDKLKDTFPNRAETVFFGIKHGSCIPGDHRAIRRKTNKLDFTLHRGLSGGRKKGL